MANQVKPNPKTLRKLRSAAVMLSVTAVFAAWSELHKTPPLEPVDVAVRAIYFVGMLLVIWIHIAQSPYRQLWWGWTFFLAGGFCGLFFTTMTILSLYAGDGTRIALGGFQAASAFSSLLGGWLLVFDKDIQAWRNERKGRVQDIAIKLDA
jgi:hypothetical protein